MTELRTAHTADLAVQGLPLVAIGWVIGRDRCNCESAPTRPLAASGQRPPVAACGYPRRCPRCLNRVPNRLICTPPTSAVGPSLKRLLFGVWAAEHHRR